MQSAISVSVFTLQVSQGNVPGVESASLAMDTEEGVEVVWNEVLFSDKKVFKAQEVLYIYTDCTYYIITKLVLEIQNKHSATFRATKCKYIPFFCYILIMSQKWT